MLPAIPSHAQYQSFAPGPTQLFSSSTDLALPLGAITAGLYPDSVSMRQISRFMDEIRLTIFVEICLLVDPSIP